MQTGANDNATNSYLELQDDFILGICFFLNTSIVREIFHHAQKVFIGHVEI